MSPTGHNAEALAQIAAGEKLDVKKTILIGAGFMASSIAWQIYDPYVTKLLDRLLSASDTVAQWSHNVAGAPGMSVLARLFEAQGDKLGEGAAFTIVPLLIGIIMTFDNIFGVIFQPAFGKLSDRHRSKWGKRRPFIFVGAPVSAVLFALIPWMHTVPTLMATIILFVFVMSLWRSPVVALMPDLTAPKLRSEGNAIINLVGGVGGAIGLSAGTIVTALAFGAIDKSVDLAESKAVFALGAVVMIAATLVLRYKVQEQDSRLPGAGAAASGAGDKEKLSLKNLDKGARRSLYFMLITLFFLFSGANAVQTFFSLFAAEQLGKSTSEATMMMLVFAVASMAAAIPAGKCGKKYGRKKTILAGMVAFMLVFLLYVLTHSMSIIWVALVVGGAANMFVTVNTLPLVLEIGGLDKVGTFTGYYYTATFSAQIASPIIYGFVRMITGSYISLFVYCPVMFALALFFLLFVKHGEADQNALEETVKQLELENAD
ncbi:MAG: MFS transporter [Oscillospiraceae bacterium]|jgi:Na+/melibiose symporter-like transporter|nr:MFS transporter [Oscillospiraceae bacterium]